MRQLEVRKNKAYHFIQECRTTYAVYLELKLISFDMLLSTGDNDKSV